MKTRLLYVEDVPAPRALDELSDIVLKTDVKVPPTGVLPRGARGTIMAVHGDGEAYDVEFAEPFHALLLLGADDVVALPGATRDQLLAATGDVRR